MPVTLCLSLRALQFYPDCPRSGPQLELIEYVQPKGERINLATPNIGAPHIELKVEDIQQFYAQLKAAGVPFQSGPVFSEESRNQGGYSIYLQDPNGIRIELIQPANNPE